MGFRSTISTGRVVQPNTLHPGFHVIPYYFKASSSTVPPNDVLVARVPYQMEQVQFPITSNLPNVIDKVAPNPHDPSVCHDKYWAQRRRLFSRFDLGCQLDSEEWYSVNPELIADHVAHCVSDLAQNVLATQTKSQAQQGVVILDAFCGCGGNSIAFGKLPLHIVSKVVCVDPDQSKLLKAAHNASLYDIPKDKLVLWNATLSLFSNIAIKMENSSWINPWRPCRNTCHRPSCQRRMLGIKWAVWICCLVTVIWHFLIRHGKKLVN
jgi:RNA cap guanine-N2 methyltransferase